MPASFPDRSGLVRIATGKISAPVSSVDLALPNGYRAFVLEFFGVLFSAQDSLAFAVSRDGGATWISDSHSDSYSHAGFVTQSVDAAAVATSLYHDSLISFANSHGLAEDIGQCVTLQFAPGSATELANGVEYSTGRVAGLSQFSHGMFSLNSSATVAPTKARINKVRCKPYDDGAAAPATHTVDAGSYVLWGVE